MCNDYQQHVAWAEYCRLMQELELEIPAHQTESDLRQADDIKIADLGPVMRASGNVIELAKMKFGFPPAGPRGGPASNFRSEGRSFATAIAGSRQHLRFSGSRAQNTGRQNTASP